MATSQILGTILFICCSLLKSGHSAEDFSSNSSSRPSGIDTANRYLPRPPVNLFNLHGGPPTDIRSQVESSITTASNSRLNGQQQDNQPANAEIDQQNAGTESTPGSNAQLPAVPQPKFPPDSFFSQRPPFNTGVGQIPTNLPNGFNFGPQPSQFNYGFGPPGFNQNIYPQPTGATDQGSNSYQQNYQPLNFRTAAQFANQYNSGQNSNSLPVPSAQSNSGQLSGVNNLPAAPPQQVQSFGQFSGFPFTSPNIGQGFQQQFTSPGFASGGVATNSGQTSASVPGEGDQGSVVGFYGGAPNIGGYTFNNQPLTEQQQSSFANAGGFPGPNFGQYTNGAPHLGSGVSQLGNGVSQLGGGDFSGFGFNAAPFQDGGGVQQGSFSNKVINQSVPLRQSTE